MSDGSEGREAMDGDDVQNGDGVRRSTLVVTNSIKVAGLVFAVREMLTERDPVVIAFCVVMMSGVQGLEQALVVFFERFFGTAK